MKIIIKRNSQRPIVTIDTKNCYHPYAIRDAMKLALELDGHSKETINEVFGIYPDVVITEDMLTPKRDNTKENEWARKSHKDSILPFSVYDLHICSKCTGFSVCLYSPYNNFIMSCNCNKPMTMIQLCLRDRDENGIEND